MQKDASRIAARIYARGVSFSQLGINSNLRWGTVGEDFFVFAKKVTMISYDGELLELP
jgi:hypothetical protein